MRATGEDASNLRVYDLPDGPLERLTFDQGFFPAWTPDGQSVSHDGRWLAYESDETGRQHVYVMPFGESGRGRQVSVASGNNPFWSQGGEELFLFNDEQQVVEALRFRADSTFQVVARETLFAVGRFGGRYAPGPGDSVFLATQSAGPRFNTRFVLVRNWIRELEARAAAAGR